MKKNRFIALALAAGMTFCNVAVTGVVAYADTTDQTTQTAVPTSQTIDTDSAADATTGKYTISVGSSDTHTYKVYQILTGTLIAGQKKLGNPTWGEDAKNKGTTTGVDDFIKAITATGLSNVEINDLVLAQRAKDASGQGTVTKDSSMNVVPGYYLIEDVTTNLADNDAKSLNIVAVFNDITITAKKGTVESEKHVDDQNDSDADDHSELKDSADYDIGDSIPYTLTMTLPEDYANYKQYYVSFVDDMSSGLIYNNDAKIYYGTKDTTGEKITFTSGGTSAYTGGTVWSATIQNLKADNATAEQKALSAGSVITIKYTATLNSNAVIGSAGNPNKYKVDFSSNPNQVAGGTPETNDTPWDTNIVFTYKTVFNKVDGKNNPLTGADFKLEKQVGDNWVDVTALHDGNVNPTKSVGENTVTPVIAADGSVTTPGTATQFTFAGLDAGKYRLTETVTPAGYNTIDPITFTITATHDLVSDTPALTELSGTDGHEFTLTAEKKDGSLTAEIVNKQGAILPSTGGMGTTILYVIGGILVIGGGAAIFIKRKKDAE